MWLRTVTKIRAVASSRAGEVAEEVTIRVCTYGVVCSFHAVDLYCCIKKHLCVLITTLLYQVHLAVATMVHEVEEEVDMAEAPLKITIMIGRLIRRVVTEVKVAVVAEDEVEEVTEVIGVAMEATEVIEVAMETEVAMEVTEVAMEAQEAEAVVAPGRKIAPEGVASQSCAKLRLVRNVIQLLASHIFSVIYLWCKFTFIRDCVCHF